MENNKNWRWTLNYVAGYWMQLFSTTARSRETRRAYLDGMDFFIPNETANTVQNQNFACVINTTAYYRTKIS